jgi:hypothetical protein
MSETNESPPANPANPADLVTLAGLAEGQSPVARDTAGRFLTGNSGGGRPKGSRNKLTDAFLSIIADDFASFGPDTVAQVRLSDPATYLKIIAAFIPRELVLQREKEPNFAGMTHDEIVELLERAKYNESILKALETIRL